MAYGTAARRVNRRSENYSTQYRVNGTSAYVPARVATGRTKIRRRQTSALIERNRARALQVGKTDVLLLSLVILACVGMCVFLINRKEEYTELNGLNRQLETQLLNLRGENDTLLESVNNSVDWNHVREVAIDELGMKYATEDQIVWYNSDESSYVRQYRNVG
ncbi:MAG: hypothetical protein Q4B09_09105 [Lachnospiraceae bacterium]|nr:hypothetical protein [Lachnospiraceae bacterium]